MNAICDEVIIVLHCGLWCGLKCAHEADSFPRSTSRGRGSVHINFPRSLHEVERTSKWQREVLREVCECVSKSGVERSPSGQDINSKLNNYHESCMMFFFLNFDIAFLRIDTVSQTKYCDTKYRLYIHTEYIQYIQNITFCMLKYKDFTVI